MNVKAPYGLTDDELLLLDAFVKGPAFPILQKIVAKDKEECASRIMQAEDMIAVARLQGRMVGGSLVEQIPLVCSKINDQKLAARRKQKPIPREELKKPAP